jgi:glyoxylase-like metal-dependent hydrolase (beta-lactamase superfamily II)
MKLVERFEEGPVTGYRFGYSPLRLVAPFTVCCYLVDGLLVDTAQRHMQREVLGQVSQQEVRQVFLTHYHEDHAGNARALRDQLKVPVYAGAETARRVATSYPILPYEQFWFGRIDACPGVEVIRGPIHTEHYTFYPLPTPGHSDDHHVLHEPTEGWLMAGDLYVGKLKFFRRGEDIGLHIRSLRKVLELDFDTVFCAHNPVLRNGKQALHAKLEYLQNLYGQVAVLYAQGLGPREIRRRLRLREVHLLRLLTSNDVAVRYFIDSVIRNEKAAQPDNR